MGRSAAACPSSRVAAGAGGVSSAGEGSVVTLSCCFISASTFTAPGGASASPRSAVRISRSVAAGAGDGSVTMLPWMVRQRCSFRLTRGHNRFAMVGCLHLAVCFRRCRHGERRRLGRTRVRREHRQGLVCNPRVVSFAENRCGGRRRQLEPSGDIGCAERDQREERQQEQQAERETRADGQRHVYRAGDQEDGGKHLELAAVRQGVVTLVQVDEPIRARNLESARVSLVVMIRCGR